MPADSISRQQRGSPRPKGRYGLDEHCKRLLAAMLELSLLQREQPRRHQPQLGEPETEEPQRHGASSRASSSLGLGRAMRQHGLGARHATALLSVALYGPMTITRLAERHHVMIKTASLIAVELEGAGLIERQEDPADRRRTIIAIAKGKERAVDEGLNKRAAPLQRTLDRLTPAQRDGLISGLEALGEELSREREERGNAHARGPSITGRRNER